MYICWGPHNLASLKGKSVFDIIHAHVISEEAGHMFLVELEDILEILHGVVLFIHVFQMLVLLAEGSNLDFNNWCASSFTGSSLLQGVVTREASVEKRFDGLIFWVGPWV